MTIRLLESWVAVAVVAAMVLGCGAEQRLPVAGTVDSTTHNLQWAEAGGLLEGEVPWVLRRDLLGPETYLVATTFDSRSECVEEISFGVTPVDGIEYTVTLASDLRGKIFWDIRYGAEQKEVKTFRCTPRPSGDNEECRRGGIPRPLFGTLTGTVAGKPTGSDSTRSLQSFRFERTPLECQES